MLPLKAQPYNERKLTFPCFAQPKLDGVRALFQCGRFYSGDEIEWAQPILHHLSLELSRVVDLRSTILDGELYVHGWSLQRINSAVAVKRKAPSVDTPLVQFHVFDTVRLRTPFIDRYVVAKQLVESCGESELIQLVPTHLVQTREECESIFTIHSTSGYEGAMYRMGENFYTQAGIDAPKDNRTHSMLKRKAWKEDDFRVVGVEEGKHTDLGGKYVGTLGAFVLQTKTGLVFTASPSFSDAERLHYFVNDPTGKVAKVKYLFLSDSGIPRHPNVLCIREA